MRWLIMSHLIKIYTICKFSYFRLWYLKEQILYFKSWTYLRKEAIRNLQELFRLVKKEERADVY